MDYNDSNSGTKGGSEMWGWREEDYCLQSDYRIDTCTLWDDLNQNEDSLLYLLEEQTPIKDCMDFGYNFSDIDGNTNKVLEDSRESSQLKRRRVLQFTSDSSDATVVSEKNSSPCLNSKTNEEALLGDGVPQNLQLNAQWNSGFPDDRCSFGNEVLEQSSEGWLANCFNESATLCSQDEMNDFIASNGQSNSSELYNMPSEAETDLVQETPTPAPRRIIRGPLGNIFYPMQRRKSLINAPMKLTTSVAYPFALIKPCEVQGDVTLKDINQRIHTPPLSRLNNKKDEDPSASYPTSAFTGKPVVVKTKIRTDGGKGSITIMRTKG